MLDGTGLHWLAIAQYREQTESIVVWFGSHVHVIYVNKAHVPQPEGGNGKASLTHTKHAQPTSVTMPVWAWGGAGAGGCISPHQGAAALHNTHIHACTVFASVLSNSASYSFFINGHVSQSPYHVSRWPSWCNRCILVTLMLIKILA